MSDRRFSLGRQSEQLYNEELYKLFESIRPLLEVPGKDKLGPESSLHGALWLDTAKNELNYYNKDLQVWDNVFRDKFQVTDGIMNPFPPDRPVYGQLWINNGVLMHYDGMQWTPIKALAQDGSQINLATFEDFLLMSPLHPPGNTVTNDGEVPPEEALKSQFLVPNLDAGRFFVNREYVHDAEVLNKVTIQYPKSKLVNKVPSWVHVNPGKITGMTKKIYKIDKLHQQFYADPKNTEFYGFRRDSSLGHYLRPGNESSGDYFVTPSGVFLSYNAAQSFDYVLGVTYEFSWIKSSGRLTRTSTDENLTRYYVGGFSGPLNVFIEGYDLEESFYDYDRGAETLEIKDKNMKVDMEVSIMRSTDREYGIVRERTLDGKGIIRMLKKYTNPVVFVNGEALHSSLGDLIIDNAEATIMINGARRGMGYSIVETHNEETGESTFLGSGSVSEIVEEQGVIAIPDMATRIKPEEGIIIFVDGLLIRKKDVTRDYENNRLTVIGLEQGQEYLLLLDKESQLQLDESELRSALVVGKVDESMLYMNNHLICNNTAVVTTKSEEEEALTATNGLVRFFLTPGGTSLQGKFKIYSEYEEAWIDCDSVATEELKRIAFSYESGLSTITINIPFANEDRFEAFAYNFANTIEKPLIIKNIQAVDQIEFPIWDHFQAGTNSLQVYLDGVRQYHDKVDEFFDGSGFSLKAPFTGRVTYVVEHPEDGASRSCERDILRKEDAIGGSPNVYSTHLSLYPGRLTVYVSGLRMPMEAFSVLDNHTILFKDKKDWLIGSNGTFPYQDIMKDDGTIQSLLRAQADEILIEVRDDYKLKEKTINLSAMTSSEIYVDENELPRDILEASDEIMIFINGVYTGLRNDSGYVKNRHNASITIVDADVANFINDDPLYRLFMMHPEKHILWQQRNGGKPYEQKAKSIITLEWR